MINLFQEAFDFQATLLGQAQKLDLEKKQLETYLAGIVKENSELKAQVKKLEDELKSVRFPDKK